MRNPQVNIIAGAKGHGKSTFAAKLIRRHRSSRALIFKEGMNLYDAAFKSFPHRTMQQYRGGKVIIDGSNIAYRDFLQMVTDHFRDGIVMIDDAAMYERNDPSIELKNLCIISRRLGVDVLLTFHSLSDVPIRLFQYVNNVLLFHTTDNFSYRANKVPEGASMQAAKLRIAGKVLAGNKFYYERIKLAD